jgi:haloacid dehalogenase superfamily, subfamily IA, variant 3 with third motif having DD or ED/haloacid dehalogenase superfamily, subfamily IA, variant 1 with third motif having Dx(3-4)D or Dx(3-4)E
VSIQAILFDLDNTLLDRTRTFEQFTNGFIATYFSHLDETREIFDRIIELDQDGYKDKEELFAELLDELPWRIPPEHSELLAFYKREYVNHALLMEQAREVVLGLREKYRLGLITNGKTAIQHGKIDRLGIRDMFDVILVSEEAGVKKPDRAIYEMATAKLELQPEQCLYIGDHPVNDIEGATNAGMRTIWFKVNQPWRDHITAAPLHTIKHLSELPALL